MIKVEMLKVDVDIANNKFIRSFIALTTAEKLALPDAIQVAFLQLVNDYSETVSENVQ
jgi:hypothetical protein